MRAPRWNPLADSTWMKNSPSLHRSRLEGAHHHEGGPPVAKQALNRLGPLDEPAVHGLEQDEELGHVLQELRAEDPVGDLVERPRSHVDEPALVRRDQQPKQPGREEIGHPPGGFDEVQGVAGRRGVDHDEVEVASRMDLVQPLHGDVVMALDELARDVLVKRIGQDPLPPSRDRVRGGEPGRPSSAWCRAWPPTARRGGVHRPT